MSSGFVDANPHALHWWNFVSSFGTIFRSTDEGLSRKKYARSFSLYACVSCCSLRMITPSAPVSGSTFTSAASGFGRSSKRGRRALRSNGLRGPSNFRNGFLPASGP